MPAPRRLVRMRERPCWIVENYGYRRCPRPAREFRYAVSLHNHSAYSVENLASLNQVVELWFMRPLKGTLQRAFGLEHVAGLNYADVKYNPPFSPEDVYRMEAAAVAPYGFDGVHLAITDHDEYLGSLELCQRRGDLNGRVAVGEELTVRLDGHVHNREVSRRGSQENHHAHRINAATVPVIGEQGLCLVIPNLDREAVGGLLQPGLAKLFQRFKNAFAHTVLLRIKEQQVFQGRTALAGDPRRKHQVHIRFRDCTRRQRSPADWIGPKSAARRFTP